MKLRILPVIALGGLIALTGCMEDKTASSVKVEVNNWYCRPDLGNIGGRYTALPLHRIRKMEENHEIVDGQAFYYKCEEQKLGVFSEEYENLKTLEDRDRNGDHTAQRLALFDKWRKEAGL